MSMGEEMVQSIIEVGAASVEPVTVRAVDSGVELSTMSVTGRMVGHGAVVVALAMAGGES